MIRFFQAALNSVNSNLPVTSDIPQEALIFVSNNGQSNHVGTNQASDPPEYLTGPLGANMYVPGTTNYDPLEFGVNNQYPNGTGFSSELPIGYELNQIRPGKVYIAKHAQSGTSMHTNWNIANNSTGRAAINTIMAGLLKLKEIADLLVLPMVVLGVAFRQGESDMSANNPNGLTGGVVDPSKSAFVQSEYLRVFTIWLKDCLNKMIAKNYDTSNFQLVISLVDSQFGENIDTTWQTEIVAAQIQMENFIIDNPEYEGLCLPPKTVSTSTFEIGGDGIHWNTNGAMQQGNAIAGVYSAML